MQAEAIKDGSSGSGGDVATPSSGTPKKKKKNKKRRNKTRRHGPTNTRSHDLSPNRYLHRILGHARRLHCISKTRVASVEQNMCEGVGVGVHLNLAMLSDKGC